MKDELIKVMILDDEYLVRELLKRSIDWESFGTEVVAEASNSMEALDAFEDLHPDIIFADICMPVINGIEFSRRILKNYPQVRIVILTGHDEFEYAKECVKIGVTDFILKPINVEEISKVLRDVCRKVKEERKAESDYLELREQIEDNFEYLREKFCNDLLSGVLTGSGIQKKLDYYRINFIHDCFRVAVIEPSFDSRSANTSEESSLMLRIKCLNIIRRYFCNQEHIISYIGAHGNIVLLKNNPESDLAEHCETIRINLKNRLGCLVSIGIGNKKKRLSEISASYHEANTALEYKIIEGLDNVIAYSDINIINDSKEVLISDYLSDLSFNLRAGLLDKACSIINEIFDSLQNQYSIDILSIRISASNIISLILMIIKEAGIDSREVFKHGKQPYDYVFRIETLPEVREYIKELSGLLVDSINKLTSKKISKLINEVTVYLKKNFASEELNQNMVAEEFNINSCYLSRKFKQETGQTFIDYLSRLRLDRAIELLKNTNLKNYEIADKVGIADPHYFSIFFKKHMNISISDFKKNISCPSC